MRSLVRTRVASNDWCASRKVVSVTARAVCRRSDSAKAAGPVFSETRFGQTVMVYDGGDRAALATLGTVTTPTLSDLFVALMTREQGAH